jgi:hypothetical protein
VLAAVGVLTLRRLRRASNSSNAPSVSHAFVWFTAYNLGVISLATILTYYIGSGGAFRIFSVHLLLTLLVAVASPGWLAQGLFLGVLLVNLAVGTAALGNLRQQYAYSFSNRARATAFHDRVKDVLVFKPTANGWANTVLTDRLPGDLSGLPAGIGYEYYFQGRFLANKVKSRYIIASPDLVAYCSRYYGLKVTLLCTLPDVPAELSATRQHANLYLNLDPAPP